MRDLTVKNGSSISRGEVAYIHLARATGAPVEAVETVEAVVNGGLRGDRHFNENQSEEFPHWRQMTLVAEEDLLDFCRECAVEYYPGCSRRQITTRGINLNALVGKTFRIGEVVCLGVELCQPCRQLTEHWTPKALRGLINRGGLRAGILQGGLIEKQSEIFVLETAHSDAAPSAIGARFK